MTAQFRRGETVLPTHELVARYRGYEIYRRQPGFEFTPIVLGKIASFLIRGADGRLSVYAFLYSLLAPLEGVAIDEADLLASALQTIQRGIDRGEVNDRQDTTFEYQAGAWIVVHDPRWWISVF